MEIGWSNIWQGYIALLWIEAFMHKRNCTMDTAQTKWKWVIKATWKTVEMFWMQRNKVVHEKSIMVQQIWESPLDAQIRNIYNWKEEFAAPEMNYS